MDDFLFPPLMELFVEYLSSEGISVDAARDAGPGGFVDWLTDTPLARMDLTEEPPEDEFISEEQEAAETIAHYLQRSDGVDWLLPFWDFLLISSRPHPYRLIKESHFSILIRWEDDVVYPFSCYIPAQLVKPSNSISDSLLVHMAEVVNKQFFKLLGSESSSTLHDIAGEPIGKDAVRKVLSLAREAIKTCDYGERLSLERALTLLQSLALPRPSAKAFSNALQDGVAKAGNVDLNVFPIGEESDGP